MSQNGKKGQANQKQRTVSLEVRLPVFIGWIEETMEEMGGEDTLQLVDYTETLLRMAIEPKPADYGMQCDRFFTKREDNLNEEQGPLV